MIELPSNERASESLGQPQRLTGVTPARITQVSWIGATLLGGLALAGWFLPLPVLYSGWPSAPHMTVNGACLFVLLGLALGLMMHRRHTQGWDRLCYRTGQGVALLVIAGALLILSESPFRRNWGIDELILKDPAAAAYRGIAGRPSFPAALSAVLLGLATTLLDVRWRRLWPAQGLILMSGLITVLGLIRYLCNVSELYGQAHTNRGNGMTVHDIFGFLLLEVGL